MKFWKFRKQIIFFCKNLSDFVPQYCENLNFSTNINTSFEIHDPKKLKLKILINLERISTHYDEILHDLRLHLPRQCVTRPCCIVLVLLHTIKFLKTIGFYSQCHIQLLHRATLPFTLTLKNLSFSLFWTKKVYLL